MSKYTKTEWKNGDVITADKLNNMEDGIAGGSGSSKTYVTADHGTNKIAKDLTEDDLLEYGY